MGTGGVGGYFGGRLAAAGEDVTFIARGPHLEAIRAHGLSITSGAGDIVIAPAQATDDPAGIGPVEFVLFSVKLYDTHAAGAMLAPLIGPDLKQIINQMHWKPPGGEMVEFGFHQDARFRKPRHAYRDLAASTCRPASRWTPTAKPTAP